MCRFKCIFNANVDAGQFQWLSCFGMDSLHADVGQLIGDDVIGMTHGNAILYPTIFGSALDRWYSL